MVETYSEYIDRYMCAQALGGRHLPGEHHFVSVYLVPRLFAINKRVPDYVNPDGMKGVGGDVVYYRGVNQELGIEVKLERVAIPKRQFNGWIARSDSGGCPQVFVGIGSTGLGVCTWARFREIYIQAATERDPNWKPVRIEAGYGPSFYVDDLLARLENGLFFPKGSTQTEASQLEARYIEALRGFVTANEPLQPAPAPGE